MIKIQRLFKSFKFALKGFSSLVKKEQNFRIHILLSIVVVFAGLYFKIAIWQWCLIILLIATVFVLEMVNTVMERLMDMLKPRIHAYVREIKDIMSAMVLVAAVASLIIGLIIFVPYFT